ncbi:MAG: restriction endonuclease [Steroidobacteraceae bacterium]
MAFGAGPFGAGPFGGMPILPRVQFDVEEPVVGQSIIQVAAYVDRALIERLRLHPDDLRTVDRRFFEELVAELFVGFGYEVELTKRTRDGGKDIVAVRRKEVDTRFLIECKRPDPGNPVTVSTVRELYGVKVDDGASKAILATTTYLTEDAKIFVERHRWELEARVFGGLLEWINAYLGLSKT